MSFLSQLSDRMDRWKLCIVFFAFIYGAFLLTELAYKSILWDESVHFLGGLLMSRGQVWQWVWTNSFYPPIFDIVTGLSFIVGGGASVFAGRLVAVTFSVLSVFMVYALANRVYGPKVALLAGIFFGVMPGIVWSSRMAMIETMLIFTFTLTMFFFYNWLREGKERDRIIFTVAIVIGVAIKYQMLVLAPIAAIAGMFFWKREYLKKEVSSFFKRPRIIITIAAFTTVAIAGGAILLSGIMNIWFYAIQVGTADKAAASTQFPMPIFYLVEMTRPLDDVHPISLLLYLTGLAGIGVFAYRRKMEDKFLLLWFAIVYTVFTIIPNREWRYVTVLFPVLAISAASVIVLCFDRFQKTWRTATNHLNKKRLAKLGALALIALTVTGVSFSCADAYYWVKMDHTQVPMDQAVAYVEQNLGNQSLMVACPVNQFNKQMVTFYLNIETVHQNNVSQYPEQAVDAYSPHFNISEFIRLCEENSTKYVLLYEYAEAPTYYNSEVTEQQIYDIIMASGRFDLEAIVGTQPRRIFILALR